MKSKAFILQELKTLLVNNMGLGDAQADLEIEGLKDLTIFELLTIKKDIATEHEYRDVSVLRTLFRD